MLERPGFEARTLRYAVRIIQRKARLRRVLRNDFMRDGAVVFASTMFANVLGYLTHFVLSRKLGVVDYGTFASLLSALAVVGIPVAFTTLIVVKFTAEFHAVSDRAKIRLLSMRILSLGALLGGLGLILGFALRGEIASFLRFKDSGDVIMASVVLSISFIVPSMRGVLQGTQDFLALAISTSIEAILKIGLAVALVFAGRGIAGIFAGYAAAGACSLCYTLLAVRRHWSFAHAKLAIDARRLLQTSGAIVIGTSAITLMGFIDVPLVKHFFDPAAAGVYSAVSVCGKMLFFVVGFIPLLVLPKAVERGASGKSASTVLRQGIATTAVFGLLGLALFFFAPGLVVRVTYGAVFLPAAQYISAYGFAMILLGLTNVVVMYKIGLHRYDFVLPLVFTVLLEGAGIYAFHATLWAVIGVIIGVNTLGLILCSLRLPQRIPVSAAFSPPGREVVSP